jgi:hypothetical protein
MFNKWAVDNGLLYRLDDNGVNYDEIKIAQTSGNYHNKKKKDTTAKMLACILNDIDNYVQKNYHDHGAFGLGDDSPEQMTMEEIRFLVWFGRPLKFEFSFYKTVSVVDDMDWEESTIIARKGTLFVTYTNKLLFDCVDIKSILKAYQEY